MIANNYTVIEPNNFLEPSDILMSTVLLTEVKVLWLSV